MFLPLNSKKSEKTGSGQKPTAQESALHGGSMVARWGMM